MAFVVAGGKSQPSAHGLSQVTCSLRRLKGSGRLEVMSKSGCVIGGHGKRGAVNCSRWVFSVCHLFLSSYSLSILSRSPASSECQWRASLFSLRAHSRTVLYSTIVLDSVPPPSLICLSFCL